MDFGTHFHILVVQGVQYKSFIGLCLYQNAANFQACASLGGVAFYFLIETLGPIALVRDCLAFELCCAAVRAGVCLHWARTNKL
eukprot:5821151-Amphidinium_carterae.1